MYSNKLAAAIKCRGKILRELGETAYLPFGTEYAILLKNLNTVRASVKVYIDGEDATEGVAIVIEPNSSVELERFIKNNDLFRGNRFKFIERTTKVTNYRGNTYEDGLVRIEFQFEAQNCYNAVSVTPDVWPASTPLKGAYGCPALMSYPKGVRAVAQSNTSTNSVGITAPGSVSEQRFSTTARLQLEAIRHAIVIQLRGERPDGAYVTKAVASRDRTECKMCGTSSKTSAKFCAECGVSLQIIE